MMNGDTVGSDRRKRIITAAAVLAGLLLLFAVINLITGKAADSTVIIDGKPYLTSARSLDLTLMTDEGLGEMSRFTRLKELSIKPYIAELTRSIDEDEFMDDQTKARLTAEAHELHPDCTMIEDVSFLSSLDGLESLSLEYCGVSDISCLKGLTSLETLNISHTQVTDISPVYDMPGIKTVYTEGIVFSDEQLEAMAKHGFSYEAGDEDEVRMMIRNMEAQR